MEDQYIQEIALDAINNDRWGKQSAIEPKFTLPTYDNNRTREENIISLVLSIINDAKKLDILGHKARKVAEEALTLYRSGLTAEEVAKKMGRHPTRIRQYYMHLGGLKPEDKIEHLKNRYVNIKVP
ncbi:MAG: hypothetical protein U0822_27315 [Anaerolineae bacterium]